MKYVHLSGNIDKTEKCYIIIVKVRFDHGWNRAKVELNDSIGSILISTLGRVYFFAVVELIAAKHASRSRIKMYCCVNRAGRDAVAQLLQNKAESPGTFHSTEKLSSTRA